MTITIDVKPEIVHRWREIAEREGRALEEVVSEAAEIGLETMIATPREYSQAAPTQVEGAPPHARGLLAHLPGSLDEFMRERSENDSR